MARDGEDVANRRRRPDASRTRRRTSRRACACGGARRAPVDGSRRRSSPACCGRSCCCRRAAREPDEAAAADGDLPRAGAHQACGPVARLRAGARRAPVLLPSARPRRGAEYAFGARSGVRCRGMRTLDAAPQEYGRLLLNLGVSRPRASLTAAGAAWSFLNLKRRMPMLQDVSPRSTRSRLLTARRRRTRRRRARAVAIRRASGRAQDAPACRTARCRRRASSWRRPKHRKTTGLKSERARTKLGGLALRADLGRRVAHDRGAFESEDIARPSGSAVVGKPSCGSATVNKEYVIATEVLREAPFTLE